ncbi:site-specific integrase [Bradyrhizobium sp. AUGA SZCCT0169]|uniref:tyrosine-type recombinase/integrase n=1 Tax=Bradyrhizobium sp. AUGA SZCCT0169 TaxID=2807663 RepID=UPI001BAA7F65|nr:site-specific integrase [Bradyrhizobium sp. AUGA SZCCT0169]MBR1247529.1 site-specific integrase [Bradyrhizobium sp. AUGA SZCCT0169]
MKSLNRKRFTQQGVERLRYDKTAAPPSGRMEVEDEACPGLLLRVTPRNVKSFSVIYRVLGEGGTSPKGRLLAGKQHRITLGATPPLELTAARRQARDIMQAATEGRDLRTERREKNLIRSVNTFEAVFKRFMEIEIIPNIAAWKNVDGVLRRNVLPLWANTPVHDIRRSHIHELIDGLVKEGKHGSAREVRKHLSRFFNWVVDREIIADNPIHGLKRSDLQASDEAGRALSDEEIRYVWQAAASLGYPFGPLYQLLLLTGQRRTEWASASRSEINLDKNWLEVPKARYKGDRDHIVPLSNEALAIVGNLPTWSGNDYHLFSTTDGRVPISGFSKGKVRLDEAVKKAMIDQNVASALVRYRVHDLRVTCETRLATLGFNQDVRDAVLGHAKPGLQKTYNKYGYFEEKRSALIEYAKHLMELVN